MGRREVVYKSKKKKTSLHLNKTIERKRKFDDEILSEDDYSSDNNINSNELIKINNDQNIENGLEKRLKLAKKYIDDIKEETNIDNNDFDPIAIRLEEEILIKAGISFKNLADNIKLTENFNIKMNDCITCVTIGDEYFFIGCKDGNIYKFDIKNGNKLGIIIGSKRNKKKLKYNQISKVCNGHILSLALSYDNKYLASSCENKNVYIWNPINLNHLHTFSGHRDWVSGVVFRWGTHQLYSTSFDRMVKIWNLDDMSYVDTLYGHEDKILSIDTLHKENALTAGGQDYSIRLFKIDKETQSLYQAERGYFQEKALMMNEEDFISISTNGSLLIWKINKRKPILIINNVHNGTDRTGEIFIENKNETIINNNPIYSIALVSYSDLIATGSLDGYVHIWKIEKIDNLLFKLEIKKSIKIEGIISTLNFSLKYDKLFIGVSKESRLGRWETIKIKNKIIIYNLFKS